MAMPSVSIAVADGALGRTVATDDGVGALLLTGVAASGLALTTPVRIYSIADAVTLGITLATHPHATAQITDFYSQAGTGAELWIMLVAETTTAYNSITGSLPVLLTAGGGRITIVGTSLGRAAGYAPSMTGLVDFDLPALAVAAQTLATQFAVDFTPVIIILDGSYLLTPLAGVVSVKGTGDRVGVFLGATESGKRVSSMGRFLGRLAAIPVHQSIARVKTGLFSANGALTSGLALSTYSKAQLDSLHDAGYMVLRSFLGLVGAYVSDDVSLASPTSDFTSIARRRVMDKAIRIAYQTYIKELNDTVEIGADGKLLPTKVSYLEDVIDRALRTRMVAEGNCSNVSVRVDPAQNVIATDKVEVVVKITPLGTLKNISVKLGFFNPANS